MSVALLFSYEPHPTRFRSGFIRGLVQTGAGLDPRSADVPTLPEPMDEFMMPDSGLALAQLVLASRTYGRLFVGPPGIAPDRATAPLDPFDDAIKVPALIAHARKGNLDPASGQKLKGSAKQVVARPCAIIERMKQLVGYRQ